MRERRVAKRDHLRVSRVFLDGVSKRRDCSCLGLIFPRGQIVSGHVVHEVK